MFVKKTMKPSAYASGADQYGNRFGGNSFKDSLDAKSLGLDKWKPAEGENIIDFIPFNATEANPLVIAGKAEVGDPLYSLEYFVHKGVGPSNDNIICLNQYSCTCPLCEEAKRIKNSNEEDAEKKAQALNAKRRIVYVVHDLKNDKYGYWDTGWKSVEEKIQKLSRVTIDPKTNSPVNIFDWQDGMSVKFFGEKKKFSGHEYIEVDLFSFVPRAPLSDEVLEHSVDLSTAIIKTSADDMEKIIHGNLMSAPKDTNKAAPQQESHTFDALPKANIEDSEPVTNSAAAAQNSAPSFDNMQPAAQSTPTTQAAPAEEKVCPHGHKFGESDMHPECGKCPVWESCFDSK